MRIVRFQSKPVVIVLFITVILLFVLQFLWKSNSSDPECIVPIEVQRKLDKLLQHTLDALTALNLKYFLCYNSLWGGLKVHGFLPWQNELELCLRNEDLAKIEEGFLIRTFKRHGLIISYNSADGKYKVTLIGQDEVPSASLIVFEKDSLTYQMRRIGWKHRLVPPDSCDQLQCFPPRLIVEPLPKIEFRKQKIPVPREEIEILKYLFPYNWWKDINPPNCKDLVV